MAYNKFPTNATTQWVSGSTVVVNFNAPTGSYTFVANYHQSSSFVVSGTTTLTGSQFANAVLVVESSASTEQPILYCEATGGMTHVGIGTRSPKLELDISLNSVSDPGNFDSDSGGGEVVYFASQSHVALTAGGLYYMNDISSWQSASAHSTGSGADRLLAISMGTDPQSHGMLIRGWFNATTFFTGTFNSGGPIYIHSGTAGFMSGGVPTGSDSYARIVGYGSANGNLIYFNPSSNWIELTGS